MKYLVTLLFATNLQAIPLMLEWDPNLEPSVTYNIWERSGTGPVFNYVKLGNAEGTTFLVEASVGQHVYTITAVVQVEVQSSSGPKPSVLVESVYSDPLTVTVPGVPGKPKTPRLAVQISYDMKKWEEFAIVEAPVRAGQDPFYRVTFE